MDTLIVYLDDAAYAKHMLAPMLSQDTPTRWVLVACAPRMSRRIGKWLSHSARENWRNKWCDKLFSQIVPTLVSRNDEGQLRGAESAVECLVAKGPLPELTQQLRAKFGAARVVDARRPKFGQELAPVTLDQPRENVGWQVPGAVGSLSALLVLASE
jgi:hypothetical protein